MLNNYFTKNKSSFNRFLENRGVLGVVTYQVFYQLSLYLEVKQFKNPTIGGGKWGYITYMSDQDAGERLRAQLEASHRREATLKHINSKVTQFLRDSNSNTNFVI